MASAFCTGPSATPSTCSSPDSMYASRSQNYKMSIAFLAGSVSAPRDTEMSDASSPSSSTHEPAPAFRLPSYNPPDYRPRTPISLPSLRMDASPYSSAHPPTLPRIGSFSSIRSTSSGISYASSRDPPSYAGSTHSSFAALNNSTSPIKRHDSLWDLDSNGTNNSANSSFHSTASFASINQPYPPYQPHHHHAPQLQAAEPLARIPRPARPSYSEEQKFFIMHHRIVKEQSWPEIEDAFARFFNLRTKDGLTSVYYRIRKSWGMEEVLKTGPDGSMSDRRKVDEKAGMFSRDFLGRLGYFEQ